MLSLAFASSKFLPFMFANHCEGRFFFFLPPWWQYLNTRHDRAGQCEILFSFPGDVWAVVLAVIDMLLRLGGFIAIIMIILAGLNYIMSSGNVEKAAEARSRIINTIIGLVIVLTSIAIVTFIGNNLR